MNKQQGATLIVVLIILILVTLLGTLAIKSGILGLKIATNSQVNALLLENSDAALFNIENPRQVEAQLASNGMFAYFDSLDNAQDQLVFCYKSNSSNFFSLNDASAIVPNVDGSAASITKIGITGYCESNWFASGRSAILSQVYLTKVSTGTTPLSSFALGTSAGQTSVPTTTKNIGATVISILPSFSGASSQAIEDCFKKSESEVGQCFEALEIPYNIQHADYTVGGSPTLKTS